MDHERLAGKAVCAPVFSFGVWPGSEVESSPESAGLDFTRAGSLCGSGRRWNAALPTVDSAHACPPLEIRTALDARAGHPPRGTDAKTRGELQIRAPFLLGLLFLHLAVAFTHAEFNPRLVGKWSAVRSTEPVIPQLTCLQNAECHEIKRVCAA